MLLYVSDVDDFKFFTASEGGCCQIKRHYHVDDVAMVLKAYHLIVHIYSQKNASSTIYIGMDTWHGECGLFDWSSFQYI